MLFESFPMLDSYPGQGSREDFKTSMEKIIDMISLGKVSKVEFFFEHWYPNKKLPKVF